MEYIHTYMYTVKRPRQMQVAYPAPIPASPRGTTSSTYTPYTYSITVHRNTQTGNSPRCLPVFGPVDGDWSHSEALARPRNFPILTIPYRIASEFARSIGITYFFHFPV